MLLSLVACRPEHRLAHAGAGDAVVRAQSTMGYGCVVPPFVTSAPGVDSGECGTTSEPYFLTTSPEIDDPAQGPPGWYRLVGRWAAAPSSWSAWAATRVRSGEEEGPPDTVSYRVLEVRDWCVEWKSVPPAYREASPLAPATAPWRTRLCD